MAGATESSTATFSGNTASATSTNFIISYPSAGTALVYNFDAFIVQVAFALPTINSGTCASSACTYKTLPNSMLILIFPPSGGIAAGTQLTLTGFTNPNHYLLSSELALSAWTFLYSTQMTYNYFTYNSIATTAISIATSPSVTLTGSILFTTEVNQMSQYQFMIQWSNTALTTLTKTVSIQYPSSLTFLYPDCMTGYGANSAGEISKCYVDTTNNVIYISIYSFQSYNYIYINTRFKGVVNPSSTAALGTFQIHVYSTTNPTHSSYVGCVYKNDNVDLSSTMTFTNSNGGGNLPPYYLEIIDLPYQDRIYSPASISPSGYFYLKFAIKPSAAISGGTMKISYNNVEISVPAKNTLNDVIDNDLLCLIDDVRYTCVNSGSYITISGVSLTVSTVVRVSIGVTNLYTFIVNSAYVINGLAPKTANTYHTSFYVETFDSSNTMQNHGEIRHSIIQENTLDPTQVTFTYMTSVAGNKNIFSLICKSPSSSTYIWDLIMFEFQVLDENGNSIFAPDLGGFADGGEFPCETSASDGVKRPTCYFKHGSTSDLGSPAYVVMKNIPTVSVSTSYEYILAGFQNPTTVGTYVPLKIYMFIESTNTLTGYLELDRIYATTAASSITTSTTNNLFTGYANTPSQFSMTSTVAVSSSTYILIEDLSTYGSFSITPSNGVVRKMFTQDTSQNRWIMYALKVSGGVTATTPYSIPGVTVKQGSTLKFHHYQTDFETGEIVTTTYNTATSYQDCFSTPTLEVASQQESQSTYAVFNLVYSALSACTAFSFVDGNVLVIALTFLQNAVTSCNVIGGLTPSYSYQQIACSISSTTLTITGWQSISGTVKLFLGITTNSDFTLSGSATASIYYNSADVTNTLPFVQSSLSSIAWPTATTNTETSFASNVAIDFSNNNNWITFTIDTSSTSFSSLTVTLGPEFSISNSAVSYYYYLNTARTTSPSVATSITSSAVTISVSDTDTGTDTVNFYITFTSGAITYPVWNIAFMYIDTGTTNLRQTIVQGCIDSALSINANSLTEDPSQVTELSFTFSQTSFDTSLYNIVLIELNSDWTFQTISSANDFPLPCIDSSNNQLVCYGHKISSTDYPTNSITYHPPGSTLVSTLYVANVINPGSSASTGINIKYVNSNYLNVFGSVYSARRTQNILYTGMNIVVSASATSTGSVGTLTMTIDGNSSPFQTLYTNTVHTLTVQFTGDPSLTYYTNDVLYMDLSQLGASLSSASTWGTTIARVYSGSWVIVANLNTASSNTVTFSTPISFSFSQKIYNAAGIVISAYVIQKSLNSDLLSSGTQTISIGTLEGSNNFFNTFY